jgi:hypothetical protein
MNPLARLWAEKQRKRLEALELRQIVADLREAQADLRPLLAEANARQKAAMRQDGAGGFVMVMK